MAATIKGTARQTNSVQRVSEGAEVYMRMLRDGTMSYADFKAVCVMEGVGFHLSVGTFSTGQANDGTAVDISEPNFLVSVPNGTTILPIRISIQVQGGIPADGQEVEALIAVDQDSAGATLTNMTAGTIYNMNTLYGNSSDCAGYVDSTNSITDPVLDIELARVVMEFDVDGTNFSHPSAVDLLYEPEAPVIINGPASLVGYWGGDAAIIGGFAQIEWLEFNSNVFA